MPGKSSWSFVGIPFCNTWKQELCAPILGCSVWVQVCTFVVHCTVCYDAEYILHEDWNGIYILIIIPSEQRSCWGVYWFHSVRLSVRLSVRPSVRLSRLPCPLCNIYSSGWILSILATNDHYHERVCRTQWPLTLTYVFKVIWPWLRKSCPLCSLYSSGWILLIFGTNDRYH